MNGTKDRNRSSQQSNGSTPTESAVRRKLLPSRGSVEAQSLPLTDLDFLSESVRPLPVPPKLTQNSRSGARCVLAVFLMLFSAYLGSIFFQGPLLPLIVISPKMFRKLVDFTMASWFLLTEVLIVKLMGIHVRQFGDHFRKSTAEQPCVSLLILNHRTQLDWLFIWGLGDPVHRMKIILKESLSRVPGAGWAMQCAAFLFLRRQLAADQNRLTGVVDYLLRVKSSCQLLIFPEGTDLNMDSLARSNQFARKNNLPYVSYTMHPRCTGFIYLVNLLGQDRMTDIYDVTVAYPDNLPSPETNIFFGGVPREVHYHVRFYPASDLPWNVDAESVEPGVDVNMRLASWLRARWLEKELLLKQYYNNPSEKRGFPDEVIPDSLAFGFNNEIKPRLTLLGAFNLIVWTVSLCFFIYLLATSRVARIYSIFVQAVFIYLTYRHGGVCNWASQWVPGTPLVTGSNVHFTTSNSSFGEITASTKSVQ